MKGCRETDIHELLIYIFLPSVHRQTFYGDDPKPQDLLAACASALPCPAEKLEMLEAVAELPPPRATEAAGGTMVAVCEECASA